MLPLLGTQYGGYCANCCVDAANIVLAPDNVSLIECASISLVACTVYQGLKPVIDAFKGNTTGKKCFIQSGSGGVGLFAIQYCSKVLGMIVATTCSPKNFDLVKECGATTVIDYHTQKIEDFIENYDVFIDTMSYVYEEKVYNKNSKILNQNGPEPSHYINIASSPFGTSSKEYSLSKDPIGMSIPEARIDRVLNGYLKSFFRNTLNLSSIKYHYVFVHPDKEALLAVSRALEESKITVHLHEILPLSEGKRAIEILESGNVSGKIVLLVDENYSDICKYTIKK